MCGPLSYSSKRRRDFRRRRGLPAATLIAAAGLLATGCEDKVSEQVLPTSTSPPKQASATPSSVPPPKPPASAGEWIETHRYKLRVVDTVPCGAPEGYTGGKFRLGVTIELEATDKATVDPVLSTPKAATLEQRGKVFQAVMKPEPTERCANLLSVSHLNPGDSAHGTLVFEAPNESYFQKALFAFKPPRWGGDSRVEVRLPDCFGDACPGAKLEPNTSGNAHGTPKAERDVQGSEAKP